MSSSYMDQALDYNRDRGSLNGIRALTISEIAERAPSVMAEEPHYLRSDRYPFVSSLGIVNGMAAHGWVVVRAQQAMVRADEDGDDRRDFTKHLLRFRHRDAIVQARELGGLYSEIAFTNSHDGTCPAEGALGLLRLICLNGLMAAMGELASFRVPHKGDIVDKVIEGAYSVIEHAGQSLEVAHTWSKLKLEPEVREHFAKSVNILRFNDEDAYPTDQILRVNPRHGDDTTTLWGAFNAAQSNIMNGGLLGSYRDGAGRERSRTSKPVRAIVRDLELNKGLWQVAQAFADAA